MVAVGAVAIGMAVGGAIGVAIAIGLVVRCRAHSGCLEDRAWIMSCEEGIEASGFNGYVEQD